MSTATESHNLRISASESKSSPDANADQIAGDDELDFPQSPEPIRSSSSAAKSTTTGHDVITVHETFRSLLRPAAAELVGSALFIFISCGSAMTTVKYQTVGNTTIGIALTFGLTIFTLAYTIGHISGGHLNFAVTFTFCILRKISILKCLLYFLAQFIGGLIGIGFLKLITPVVWWKSCFAANFVHPELTVGHAFVAEFILTFFLMFVIMAACDSNKSNQTLVPLAIGLAVFVAHMIGLPITGCSINPTRTFASSAAASGITGCEQAWSQLSTSSCQTCNLHNDLSTILPNLV